MSKDSSKPPVAVKPGPATPAPGEPRLTPNNAGRVTHDERGNAIWEWSAGTGALSLESSTQRLRKLDNPTLSLVEDGRSKNPLVKANPRGAVQGYSPYDSGQLGKTQRPHKKDLRRLSEWLKLKKQVDGRKPDDE